MRSEFEKNRYWIGLFKTDVEFNGLIGEFGRYELNGSREVNHSYLEDFNSKWEAYAKAWQHQQSKVDELQKQLIDQGQRFNDQAQRVKDLEHKNGELQKRVDLTLQLVNEMKEKRYPFSAYADQLEQALKGGSSPDLNVECPHFSTTLFHDGKAECFQCDAVVNEDREVIGKSFKRKLMRKELK